MKISLLGNIGNIGSRFAYYFRKYGVETNLYIEKYYKTQIHSNPLSEYPEYKNNSPNWLIYIPAKYSRLIFPEGKSILRKIDNCDIIHTFGESCIWGRFCKNPYLFWSYGFDLDKMPFQWRGFNQTILSLLMRSALKKATRVIYAMPHQKEIINKLRLKNSLFYSPIPIDCKRNLEMAENSNMDFHFLKKYNSVFVHLTRHIWKTFSYDQEKKNNHYLIQAFARFLKVNPNSVLVMIKAGPDIHNSEKLIEKLDISSNIIWLDYLQKVDYYNLLLHSTMNFDQFHLGSGGFIIWEAMSVGIPSCLYYSSKSLSFYEEAPPILNAHTEEDIFQCMLKSLDKDFMDKLKQEQAKWLMKYYHWENVMDYYYKLYKKILSEG